MNNNIKNTLRTGVIAALGITILSACSDTWDDHYESTSTSPQAFDGTTMQALEQDAPAFASIVKAVGFDEELNSSSSYTVWAPADGTYNSDSLLSLVSTNKAGVVKEFVKNHIARYSIPLNLESQKIALLNNKVFTMTDKEQHMIGDITISSDQNNIKTSNGILHVINGKLPFQYNLYEFIEAEYNKSTNPTKADSSLYAYLETANADSLIESRSVYRGYDEYGNKIWIDSVTQRNNTILRDMNALIYEEDSSYIALVPSVEAYQERYSYAKSLLKFNPSMDDGLEYSRSDSLQNEYANRFAMGDLFFNRNLNIHWDDSLMSTEYSSRNWPKHLYYRKAPRTLPEDKKVNDILAKIGVADSVVCSNGIAYTFDEYPMSVYEQFFNKINMNAMYLRAFYIDKETKIKGSNVNVTKNVSGTDYQSGTWTVTKETYPELLDENNEVVTDEDGQVVYDYTQNPLSVTQSTQTYSYFYIYTSGTQSPSVAFEVPNNFSGKYDIYLVTMPIWFYLNETEGLEITNTKAYRFRANIWEKDEDGNYPKSGTALKVNDESLFTTPAPTDIEHIRDTTYLGEYDFSYSYYNEDEAGVLFQIVVNVPSSLKNDYSMNMLFSGLILKPHDDEDATATEIKASQLKMVDTKNKGYIVKTIKK